MDKFYRVVDQYGSLGIVDLDEGMRKCGLDGYGLDVASGGHHMPPYMYNCGSSRYVVELVC